MSVKERFQIILKMTDKSLMVLIDQYNKGNLSPKTKFALEMIEAFCKD